VYPDQGRRKSLLWPLAKPHTASRIQFRAFDLVGEMVSSVCRPAPVEAGAFRTSMRSGEGSATTARIVPTPTPHYKSRCQSGYASNGHDWPESRTGCYQWGNPGGQRRAKSEGADSLKRKDSDVLIGRLTRGISLLCFRNRLRGQSYASGRSTHNINSI